MGAKTHGSAVLAALLLLILPSSLATQSTGELSIQRALEIPSGGQVVAAPLAFYLEGTTNSNLTSLSLIAPSVRICYGEQHYWEFQGTLIGDPTRDKWSCETERFAQVSLLPGGVHDGWLGLYPKDGSSFTVLSADEFPVEYRSSTTLSSPAARQGAVGADGENSWYYYERFDSPHLYTATAGAFEHSGPGTLKVYGPDFRVVTGTRTTDYVTGTSHEASVPFPETTKRWAILEVSSGTIALASAAPGQVVSKDDARVAWDGTARFAAQAGTLIAGTSEYRVHSREEQRLDGRFEGTVSLGQRVGELVLRVQGDMRSTSLLLVTVPVTSGPEPVETGLLVVGLAVVGAGATALAVRQRARMRAARPVTVRPTEPEPPVAELTPEQVIEAGRSPAMDVSPAAVAAYAACALREAEAENWSVALRCFEVARRAAPSDASLAKQEANCLYHMGEFEPAMMAFEQVLMMSPDADAALWAAVCAAKLDQPARAETFLAALLNLAPCQLGDVLAEKEFGPLQDRPSFQSLIEAAQRRYDAECQGPDDETC